jgi:hypothetical protein
MKHIRLFENFDSVNESEFVAGDYKMNATPEGEIKVTDTKNNKSYVYVVSAGIVGIKVKDFPNGDSISVSALGKNITSPLQKDGETIKAIKTNIGKPKIKFELPQASLTLTCKSGCQKTGTPSNDLATIKVTKEDMDLDFSEIWDAAKDSGKNVMKSVEGGVDKLKSMLSW